MRTVDIEVLKSRLSEYLRVAASGETVVVTDRGRVLAELGPPRRPMAPLDDILAGLSDDREDR